MFRQPLLVAAAILVALALGLAFLLARGSCGQ
jgi:hypothetical protein